jgi:23S rRNA (cytidine1920-2'-O)/16S rRNA (cytidine1409-2'-O)-methyltransferase
MKSRDRLDRLLVERGLCESRTRAQALVLAGKVVVDDHAVTKPGTLVSRDASLRLKGQDHAYVSRGGLKLRGALDAFADLSVEGRWAMDVGASTGGFTDCLLQAGVEHVYAVDVGYGQLAWKLARDPRVTVLDRQNIRELEPSRVERPVDLVVADCSFISLRLVLEAIVPLLTPAADVVALVKPQFEVGRERVGKGGIVRDPAARRDAIDAVLARARELGFSPRGECRSPIEGKEGNVEFLVWLSWSAPGEA